MTSRTLLWERVHEWIDQLVIRPVVDQVCAYVDDRITRLEGRITMANASFDQAMQRFADVQSQGFDSVRTYINAAVAAATQGDADEAARQLASLNAGVDSLAAGFAQFAQAANDESSAPSVPENSIPVVVNPDLPADAPAPDAGNLPVDPVEVVNDPTVNTPADSGADNSQVGDNASGSDSTGGADVSQGATPEPGAGAADAGSGGGGDPAVNQAGNVSSATAGGTESANATDGPATS